MTRPPCTTCGRPDDREELAQWEDTCDVITQHLAKVNLRLRASRDETARLEGLVAEILLWYVGTGTRPAWEDRPGNERVKARFLQEMERERADRKRKQAAWAAAQQGSNEEDK